MNRKYIILSLLIFSLVLVFITGCTKQPEYNDKMALVIVTCNNQFVRQHEYSNSVKQSIHACLDSYGTITIVGASSDPSILYQKNFDIADLKANDYHREKIIENIDTEIRDIIIDSRPNTDEVDMLETVRRASAIIDEFDDSYTSHQLIIIGGGVSTTGVYRADHFTYTPEAIADEIESRFSLPYVHKPVEVLWYAMGEYSGDQVVSQSAKDHLWKQYSEILTRAGYSVREPIAGIISTDWYGEDIDDYPTCKTYDLSDKDIPVLAENKIEEESTTEEKLTITLLKTEQESSESSFEAPTEISENEGLIFMPDSDQLVNPEAIHLLDPIINYYLNNNEKILLVGCSAGDNDSAYSFRLSCTRASRIKEYMVENGIPGNRITAVGVSCCDLTHISGLIPPEIPEAAVNRKVVIASFSSESDYVSKTLEIYDELIKKYPQ